MYGAGALSRRRYPSRAPLMTCSTVVDRTDPYPLMMQNCLRKRRTSALPRQTQPRSQPPGGLLVCGSGAPTGEFGRPSAGVTRLMALLRDGGRQQPGRDGMNADALWTEFSREVAYRALQRRFSNAHSMIGVRSSNLVLLILLLRPRARWVSTGWRRCLSYLSSRCDEPPHAGPSETLLSCGLSRGRTATPNVLRPQTNILE
jgi:hypothetical protein